MPSNDVSVGSNSSKGPWAWKGLPRRKTGFQASSLVPGSVSTIVTFAESDEEQSVGDVERSHATPLSFTDVFDSDVSSEYDTDLEEEFPGQYCRAAQLDFPQAQCTALPESVYSIEQS